jgi:hypothetical protein
MTKKKQQEQLLYNNWKARKAIMSFNYLLFVIIREEDLRMLLTFSIISMNDVSVDAKLIKVASMHVQLTH